MANLTKQNKQDKWTDDLLIKDTSGRVHPFKDKGFKEKPSLLSSLKPIEPIVQNIEANINTAPADDNFKSGDSADFSFHPDDQKQLNEIAKTMQTDTSHKYSVEKIVDRLMDKQGLKFDKANKDFFTNIIFDFFRNRKKIIAVRDLLSKQVFVGKNKLSEDVVDNVLSVVKGIKNKINTVGGLVVRISDMPSQTIPQKLKPEFKLPEEPARPRVQSSGAGGKPIKKSAEGPEFSRREPVKPARPHDEGAGGEPEHVKKPKFDLPTAPPAKPKPVADLERSREDPKLDDEIKPIEVKVTKTDYTALPKVSRPGSKIAKQQITDVVKPARPREGYSGAGGKQPDIELESSKKIASKKITTPDKTLSGPIEELQSMTLSNFRYLGDSAQERIDKILEKIKFLEKDGYTKKARGIEAWRQSKVYQMYLNLGADSMVESKEVANLIKEYEKDNKETLSVAEFSGISDLNKQLRF